MVMQSLSRGYVPEPMKGIPRFIDAELYSAFIIIYHKGVISGIKKSYKRCNIKKQPAIITPLRSAVQVGIIGVPSHQGQMSRSSAVHIIQIDHFAVILLCISDYSGCAIYRCVMHGIQYLVFSRVSRSYRHSVPPAYVVYQRVPSYNPRNLSTLHMSPLTISYCPVVRS